jgi:DNA-binding NtrC family response regulator
MERAQILCQASSIQAGDLGLSPVISTEHDEEVTIYSTESDLRQLYEIEKDVIDKRLTYYNGDAAKAARSLGLSRSAFYRRIVKPKE